MPSRMDRGQSGSQVSSWVPAANNQTPPQQTSIFTPYGLRLRHTITSSGAVTIPAGIQWVYVIMTSGGGSGYFGYGGAGGEFSYGWTFAANTCVIGAGAGGGAHAGFTRYGHIIAVGPRADVQTGKTNYYGQPGGIGYGDAPADNGEVGINAGRGGGGATPVGANGGDGVSGGGGGPASAASGTTTGGNGGSGLIGGGGGQGSTTTDTRIGGNGGNGIGIDGTVYTGGIGSTRTNATVGGGGGAGIAGNGGNASLATGGTGGLGGGGGGSGGTGGAGILYIFY